MVNGYNWKTSCYKLARIRNIKDTCFLSYMEDRAKGKQIHKKKHDHIQSELYNMVLIVELLYGTRGKRKRKRER
jgi:hypothetical protein